MAPDQAFLHESLHRDELYVVKKRRSTDFEALKLGNVGSGRVAVGS